MIAVVDSGEEIDIRDEVELLVARLDEQTALLYELIEDLIRAEATKDVG